MICIFLWDRMCLLFTIYMSQRSYPMRCVLSNPNLLYSGGGSQIKTIKSNFVIKLCCSVLLESSTTLWICLNLLSQNCQSPRSLCSRARPIISFSQLFSWASTSCEEQILFLLATSRKQINVSLLAKHVSTPRLIFFSLVFCVQHLQLSVIFNFKQFLLCDQVRATGKIFTRHICIYPAR